MVHLVECHLPLPAKCTPVSLWWSGSLNVVTWVDPNKDDQKSAVLKGGTLLGGSGLLKHKTLKSTPESCRLNNKRVEGAQRGKLAWCWGWQGLRGRGWPVGDAGSSATSGSASTAHSHWQDTLLHAAPRVLDIWQLVSGK